jgi:RNA polymerase sigma factor (sigma-70 family)
MTGTVDSSERDQRLSRIATQWSMVAAAHDDAAEDSAVVRRALFEQYAAAGYQYLLGAVRDPDIAEELCHDFAVRFLGGNFHRADPGRGRFRDYVKKALINLVNDYHRKRKHWPRPLPGNVQIAAEPAAIESARSFEECLREELLQRTWNTLAESLPMYHAVLRMRVDQPNLSSAEIAKELTAHGDKQVSPEVVRKTLQRARAKFAELLLKEVSRSCEDSSVQRLCSELEQLDLLKYCQSALERHDGLS